MRRALFVFHLSLDLVVVALVLIVLIDSQTLPVRAFVGGSPEFYAGDNPSSLMTSARVFRFPPIQQGEHRAAVLDKEYYYCDGATGEVLRIPRTYQTDFASIPRVAGIIIDRFGYSLEPATIHDWLYSVGAGRGTGASEAERARADRIFVDALEANGVGLATRTVMYWAVRLFGGAYYGDPREWDGRFVDPVTAKVVSAPLERPATAVVATIDCTKFEKDILWLVGCFSAEPERRFTSADEIEEYCGDGPRPPEFSQPRR